MPAPGRRQLLAVLTKPTVLPLAVFAWLAATAWLRPLSLPDEGRYVGVALEMLWSGNWLVPTLDTLPYFHKPPLFYWMTAASLATLGINEWAARLGSLLAATGCALGVYHFLRRWAGDAHARLALLVLLTTPFFYGGAQFANLDMLVAACIAGTILCAAHAVLAANDGPLPRPALAAAYVLAALGLLAKGLIGIAIPGMVIGIWLLVIGRPRMILRLVWLPGVALFGLVALPWFAADAGAISRILRLLLPAPPVRALHVAGLQQSAAVLVRRGGASRARRCPGSSSLSAARAQARAGRRTGSMPRQVQTLMWIWLVSTLVFFSIPKSKLIGYVLVAVPPFAALVADGLARAAGTPGAGPPLAARVAVVALLVCATILVGRRPAATATATTPASLPPSSGRCASPADTLVALHHYPFSLPSICGIRSRSASSRTGSRAGSTQKDTGAASSTRPPSSTRRAASCCCSSRRRLRLLACLLEPDRVADRAAVRCRCGCPQLPASSASPRSATMTSGARRPPSRPIRSPDCAP